MLNREIVKFFKSESKVKYEDFDGLGDLEEFEIVLELDNGMFIVLEEEKVSEWDYRSNMFPMNSDFDNNILQIEDVILPTSDHGLYLKTKNNMVISHCTFFHSELIIENYKEVFDEEGKIK